MGNIQDPFGRGAQAVKQGDLQGRLSAKLHTEAVIITNLYFSDPIVVLCHYY